MRFPDITESVYELVLGLPRHDFKTSPSLLPANGIYLFFEKGELAPLRGVAVDRIVRVGTHNRDGNFRGRIRQHYGRVNSLGGNKNGSVFRKHVGGALLRQQDPSDPRLPAWERQMGPSYPEVEEHVSTVLRDKFTFVCFSVPSSTERLQLESGLIALLAQYPLGQPSPEWLGRFAASDRLRSSGLWNTSQVDAAPLTPELLTRLECLVKGRE